MKSVIKPVKTANKTWLRLMLLLEWKARKSPNLLMMWQMHTLGRICLSVALAH
ncbi:Uncharacterised protein [Vibrio cholerae]|uniref:Uncharacterized protein n=1 Tax=Vibrio cholerae TaxID=666 RepID=A0A655P9D3_VIBCL|nr:Uncharacterised protein [Vibrio cholerae]